MFSIWHNSQHTFTVRCIWVFRISENDDVWLQNSPIYRVGPDVRMLARCSEARRGESLHCTSILGSGFAASHRRSCAKFHCFALVCTEKQLTWRSISVNSIGSEILVAAIVNFIVKKSAEKKMLTYIYMNKVLVASPVMLHYVLTDSSHQEPFFQWTQVCEMFFMK